MADSSEGAKSGSSATAWNRPLAGMQRAGQRLGVEEGERHDDRGRQRRDRRRCCSSEANSVGVEK